MHDANTASRILEKAREMYFGRGFVHVTMDELAYELGMSKRTVYEYFPSKKVILRQALLQQVEIVTNGLAEIGEDPELDPIEKLRKVVPFLSETLPRFSRRFLLDTQRSAPELWKEMDGRRSEVIQRFFRALFEEGQSKGLIRSDLSLELSLLLLRTLVQGAVNPDVLSRVPFSTEEVVLGVMGVFTNGILTEEGRRSLQRE